MSRQIVLSTDVIRCAIEDKVRGLGGNDQDSDDVAFAAAYAVLCHGVIATKR